MPDMTYADLMDKLIQQRDDLIRENERLKAEIERLQKEIAESANPEK